MSPLRCGTYLRFSSDKQSPRSIDDQLRICSEYAVKQGWTLLQDHIYREEALSGVGTNDRPALARLIEAALSPIHPFDVILVDDTSRLSRNLAESARIYERLNFAGIRIVAVSQGIDTQSEQSDVLVTVHSLVDSLYVKELAKKTHRGLEGKVLCGFHAGGRCFGYRNVQSSDGVRLEVDQTEAALVRRIFDMAGGGHSLKTIAKTLNAENVPPPRPRAGRQRPAWCPTAIRAMLRNERYIGKEIWNRARFVKAPGSNKRLRRERPRSEWRIVERPELRIVSDEQWRCVQDRLQWVKQRFGIQNHPGLLRRAASSRYLLSGFLKCGVCGANLTIVSGRSGDRHPRYGCPQNFYRGTCSNFLRERRDWLETRLFARLQEEVLKPEVIDYTVSEFGRQLESALQNLSGQIASTRAKKAQLESELHRLTVAVAEAGHSKFLLEAIDEREKQLVDVTTRLQAGNIGSVQTELCEIRRFVTANLADVPSLLNKDVTLARAELARHVNEIRMEPNFTERHYTARGEWDLLGGNPETDRARHLPGVRARMVAGAGFEPATFGL
jgi:site-specific DNA recombinase